MKLRTHSFILIVVLAFWSISIEAQTRQERLLDTGWKFALNPDEVSYDYDALDWGQVAVPHDWAIEGPFMRDGNGDTGKLPWKGVGWYAFKIPGDWIPSGAAQRHLLLFDGAMAFPAVYLNGEKVGGWDYGYNSFYIDLQEFLRKDEDNTLMVRLDTRPHDSRWYPGAGLFRKVSLLTLSPVHTDIWGVQVTTPVVKESHAEVIVGAEIRNLLHHEMPIRIQQVVRDPLGKVVSHKEVDKVLDPKSQAYIEATHTVGQPRRWDVEDPNLYTVEHLVRVGDVLMDSTVTSFGIRTMEFTPDDGFRLNGRRVQLKGVNLHHDHGPLGAAFNKRAMERQLEIMKSMGVNAIRNSHNVAAPELLELCDRMGLLFFNEIFDKYDAKAGILDTTHIDDFAHRNIRNWVKRDRNHPSVFLWSVGNEIGDVQWNLDGGFRKLRTMINYVRKYDHTRPVTLVNDNWRSAELRHFDFYDVHAWNYDRRYRLARQLEPNKSVVISESASTVSTRGFYEFPLPGEKTDFTSSLQVSSYDLHAPYWAEIADDDFMWQQDEPYIAGEFVWTGFDYLGEPTPYTNRAVQQMGMTDEAAARSSYFGIVDLVGIPKDRYYLYKSYWKPKEPTLHILPHWNWPDRVGDTVPVFVYTNAPEAELFVNGKSQGRRRKDPKSRNSVERFRLMWKDVVYQPGEVRVVAYQNGERVNEAFRKTTGDAYTLRVTPDRTTLDADGADLSYVLIEAVDRNGLEHPLADHRLTIELEGPGEIAGVGNGNPQSFEPFQSNQVKLFYGKAMLIVRSVKGQPGTLKIRVNGKGLASARTRIRSN